MTEQLTFFRDTLAEARKGVAEHLEVSRQLDGRVKPIDCPCCGQVVKLYPRRLYGKQVAWLCMLVARWEQDPRWYSVREIKAPGGDYAKLRYFELIVRATNDDPDKGSSGMWKPTPFGVDFARGRATCLDCALVFDNTCYKLTGKHVTIHEALGRNFSYMELMGAVVQ